MSSDLLADIRSIPKRSHITAFYATDNERLDIMSAYYRVGLENNELCIFVTKQTPEDFIKDLAKHDLDIATAVDTGQFHIFPMYETYLPNGAFKASQMLANLRQFVQKGKHEGYTAVRGGGDMDWMAEEVEGRDEVVEYEGKINRFIRSNSFTGICILPKNLLNSKLIRDMMQNHQFIIRDGHVLQNPYYVPPEQAYRLDIHLISQIETWLDQLDERDAISDMAPGN